MTELLLHMNNYSITGVITAYQTYPKCCSKGVYPTGYTPIDKCLYSQPGL